VSPESPWLRGPLVVALVLIVQEALLRGLRIDGVRPDLLLGAGIVAALVAGPDVGSVVAFGGSLLGDLFVNTPFGLSALVACVVAYVAGSIQRGVNPNHRWSVPVLTAVGSATGVTVWAALGTVLGLPSLLNSRLVVIVAVVATVNLVVAAPLAVLMRWALTATSEAGPTGSARRLVA
jgi:rod shape-determining protein MreD